MNIIELLREFRIGPYAVFDFALSYIAVFFLSPLLTKLALKVRLKISRTSWLWLVLPFSLLIHIMIGLNTPMVERVFDLNQFYLEKLVILVMLFMGLKDIKIVVKKKKSRHK